MRRLARISKQDEARDHSSTDKRCERASRHERADELRVFRGTLVPRKQIAALANVGRGGFRRIVVLFFFFNDPATTEIYTLSLHDALPISRPPPGAVTSHRPARANLTDHNRSWWSIVEGGMAGDLSDDEWARLEPLLPSVKPRRGGRDRKSTRLNSSHPSISYAVFCLKKKK